MTPSLAEKGFEARQPQAEEHPELSDAGAGRAGKTLLEPRTGSTASGGEHSLGRGAQPHVPPQSTIPDAEVAAGQMPAACFALVRLEAPQRVP